MSNTFLYGQKIQSGSIPAHALSGGVVSSSAQASSWTVLSASFATTASYAENAGGAGFPFSGSAVITGSLLVSGSSNISGALNLAGPPTAVGSSIGSIRFNFPSTAIDTSSGQFVIDFDQTYDDNEYNNLKITNTIAKNTSTGAGIVNNYVTLQNTDLFVESISSTNNGSLTGFEFIGGQTGSMPRMQGDLLIISRTASFGTILGNGNVGLGPALVLISGSTQMTGSLGVLGTVLVNGQISASSYTSSLNNQVGYFGTSSWAVNASTSSYVTSDAGLGNPTVVNTNAGGGLVLQGTGVGQVAQLRIVPNAGGWVDNINTAYFQVLATTGNYLTVMGGTYAADTVLERLQFNSKFTQLSNGFYNTTPAPSYVFQVLNLTSSVTPVVSILGNSSQTANYLDVTTDGGTTGSIFTIKGTGNVGIGVPAPETKLQVQGNVSASSYTSSLNNQVGFFGTSSFAVSSSRAISASFAQTAISASYFSGSVSFPDGLTVGQLTASNAQLTNIVDTTATNKILVLNTTNNQIFTTASVGGGGSGTGFPFSGSAVITGSLLITGSGTGLSLRVTGSTQMSGSGLILQVSGNTEFRDNLKVNGGTLFVDTLGNTVQSTGSVYIEGNGATNTNLYGTNTIDDFNQIIAQNLSATTNASTDFVAAADNATDFQNFADFGINSSTFVGLIGNANDGYLYITSSLGELVIGNASTGAKGNVRLFTGAGDTDNVTRMFISSSGNVGIGTSTPKTRFEVAGNQINSGSLIVTQTGSNGGIQVIGNALTGSVFSGSFINILEMSMAVSGTIVANGTSTVTLDVNQANYFTISASVAGTTTWVVNNPPPTGRVQTFVLEYTNGGIKTNNWFTNTRWPAGVAPTLSSASANPDLLSFTTDDAGANWRGLLLQRGSA